MTAEVLGAVEVLKLLIVLQTAPLRQFPVR